jgi:hypothetical protein
MAGFGPALQTAEAQQFLVAETFVRIPRQQ